MSDSTAPASGDAPKLLFGAPVNSNAASTGASVFDTSNVRPFGAPAAGAAKKGEDDDAEGGDGQDFSDPNFKPLVENLQKVEAKELGDDESKIFTKRSKLYRFVPETNEWKERCIGDLNLIKNSTTGKVRIEMRMEKTQRVQINHFIQAESALKAVNNSTKMWMWKAFGDTSFETDGTPINVTVAARFGDEEGANAFKKMFEETAAASEKKAAPAAPKEEAKQAKKDDSKKGETADSKDEAKKEPKNDEKESKEE